MSDAAVWCVLLVIGSAAGLVAYEVLVRATVGGERGLAVRVERAGGAKADAASEAVAAGWRTRARVLLDRWTRLVERFAPLARSESDDCRERLRKAGVAVTPETWRSVRVLSSAGCALLAGALSTSTLALSPLLLAAAVTGAGAVGWALPAADLSRRTRKRRASIEAWLPDAMELLGIAIAAGSPVEQCFREVAASMEGPLAEEFVLVDQEVNLLGLTREQALGNLAQRCCSQEVSAFVAQLTQAISQGSSIASGLAVQAALARDTAQADALERIRKMPTKLDIVLSLCFLPPTVVLVIVPTVVNLLAFLNDSMT